MTQAVAELTLPLSGPARVERGTRYFSPSRKHFLAFEDGNDLVVRTAAGDLCWTLGSVHADLSRVDHVALQTDGNLVVSDKNDTWIWSTLDQDPDAGSQLTLTDGGVLQLVNTANIVRWASDRLDWPRRRTIADPAITIVGSRLTSEKAMDAVCAVYTEITGRLTAAYPRKKLDGYVVYLTNGDAWSDIRKMGRIGTEFGQGSGTDSGDFIRGGTAVDFLWIEEQMICKTGVQVRNDGADLEKWAETDHDTRTFDQVVHEFAHAIDKRNGLGTRIAQVFTSVPGEEFAWAVQNWFGCPAGQLTGQPLAFLTEIFGTEVFSSTYEFANPGGATTTKPVT